MGRRKRESVLVGEIKTKVCEEERESGRGRVGERECVSGRESV